MKSFLFFLTFIYSTLTSKEETEQSFYQNNSKRKFFCFLVENKDAIFMPYILDLHVSRSKDYDDYSNLKVYFIRGNFQSLRTTDKDRAFTLTESLNEENIYNLNPILALFGMVDWNIVDIRSREKFFETISYCEITHKENFYINYWNTMKEVDFTLHKNKYKLFLSKEKDPRMEVRYELERQREPQKCILLKQDNIESFKECPYKNLNKATYPNGIDFSERFEDYLIKMKETIEKLKDAKQKKLDGREQITSISTSSGTERFDTEKDDDERADGRVLRSNYQKKILIITIGGLITLVWILLGLWCYYKSTKGETILVDDISHWDEKLT